MIYFIRQAETNYIKIGYTKNNPKERIGQLQTSSPHKLSFIGYTFGSEFRERMFHILFDSIRISGEWFSFDESDYSIIGDITNDYRSKLHSFCNSDDYRTLINKSCVICFNDYAVHICDNCKDKLKKYLSVDVIEFIDENKSRMYDESAKSFSHINKPISINENKYHNLKRISDHDINDFIIDCLKQGLSGNQIIKRISGNRNFIIARISMLRGEI